MEDEEVDWGFSFVRRFIGFATSFGGLRCIVGSLFVLAAGLKAHQFATGSLVADSLISSRPIVALSITGELTLAGWLCSGFRQSAARIVALATFGLFACVALARAWRGDASCGCLGAVPVHPMQMLVVDLAVLTALLIVRPVDATRRALAATDRWRLELERWSVAGVLITVVVLMARVSLSDSFAAVVDPSDWIGRPCSTLGALDIEPELNHGRWLVLFSRRHCAECHRVFETIVEHRRASHGSFEVAVLEVQNSPAAASRSGGSTRARPVGRVATGTVPQFVETPLLVVLADGVVTQVFEASQLRNGDWPAVLTSKVSS